MAGETLIILVGQEGAGKSTTVRALAPAIPWSARIDAEDLSYINPWSLDDTALHLLWKNVADLTRNYWAAGFRNVVAASFVSNIDHYTNFRDILNAPAVTYLIHLCAVKAERDIRRIERPKPSTQEWRDHVDRVDPEDTTLAATHGDYRYLRIDNGGSDVSESIDRIRHWAPELFTGE
jgi:energy-coupling factor transporter ATP-binding protein EcfA2